MRKSNKRNSRNLKIAVIFYITPRTYVMWLYGLLLTKILQISDALLIQRKLQFKVIFEVLTVASIIQ